MRYYIFIFAATVASILGCAQVLQNPRIEDLRLYGPDGIIEFGFSPETMEYELSGFISNAVGVTAAAEDEYGYVEIYANGKLCDNNSVLPLKVGKNQIKVVVSDYNRNYLASSYIIDIDAEPEFEGDFGQLSIYQVMVASFIHSDAGAVGFTDLWGPPGHRVNGNLKGITESLDYIKSMGMNGLWMTPIFDCRDGWGGEKMQATGYFCTDYFEIDPRFGSKDDLHELINEAHKRGIHVFLDLKVGRHGGVEKPSPQGHYIKTVDPTYNYLSKDYPDGVGNIAFPESLPFFYDVIRYYIDEFEVDGFRLDQSYQAHQEGHNYWKELRECVEQVCAERKARGCKWGTLGYLVAEDWTYASNICSTRNGGVKSVFDFDGRFASFNLKDVETIKYIYQKPSTRGYEEGVRPNFFISNHDIVRLAETLKEDEELITRYAILGAYSGPVTFYYNEEFGDVSNCNDGSGHNSRTTGHLEARDEREQRLHDAAQAIMYARRDNPAMWRGTYSYRGANGILEVKKYDAATGNTVYIIFSDNDGEWTLSGSGIDVLTGNHVEGTVSITKRMPMVVVSD